MTDAFYFMSGQVSSGQNTVSSKLKGMDKSVGSALKGFYRNANKD